MNRQSALDLGGSVESTVQGLTALRTGQVACPFTFNSDPDKFNDYITRCLSTWSVDVVLDDGQYISFCRIIAPSGNLREGFRRMLEFPKLDFSNRYWLGDKVVVGFLNGTVARPVILGCLYPVPLDPNPATTLATISQDRFVVTDPHEWADRHEVVDYGDPSNPLPSYTDSRNTGAGIREEHVVVSSNGTNPSDNSEAHLVEVDTGASILSTEHLVQLGPANQRTVSVVQHEDNAALTLKSRHATQQISGSSTLNHSVSVEDLSAKVLQLQQLVEVQAGLINQLYLRSDNATQVGLQHEGQNQSLLITSDDSQTHFGIVKVDKNTSSNASVALEKDSVVTIRRRTQGADDSWVQLDSLGNVSLRSSHGPVVHLSAGRVAVHTNSAMLTLDDTAGISIVTATGEFISLHGDVVAVSGKQVNVSADAIGLSSGVVRVGSNPSGDHFIPASDVLYPKLKVVEERLARLEGSFIVHAHPAPNAPPTPTGIVPGTNVTFLAPEKDSLKTFKGD